MKQPSHLAKSRHGVFYFRLSFRTGCTIKEKRISLKTKNPQEARFKSSCLSAIMLTRQWERQAAMEENKIKMAESIAGQGPDSDFLLDLLQQVDRQQLSELAGVPLSEVNQLLEQPAQTNIRKLDIEMPGGFTLRNISSDEDMNRAVHILQTLNLSVDSMAKLLAGPNPTPVVPVTQAPVQKTEEGGTTIQEMVPRYATRKRNKLADVALSGAHVSTPCMSTITQSTSHLLNKRFARIVG